MSLLEALILGLVQGLTEFLPVSSSGHLALGRALLGMEATDNALFEVLVHVATALAILTVYRAESVKILKALPPAFTPGKVVRNYVLHADVRMVWWLLASAVPAGVLGILFKDQVEGLFNAPRVVGGCLIATGLWLLVLRKVPTKTGSMNFKRALAMGCAQAVAILPGISRSGSTIGMGLMMGGERTAVGRFAFLMALIPILGAALLNARHIGEDGAPSVGALILGFLAAYASGLFALRVLISFVARGGLWVFGPYCLLAGVAALVFG